MNHPEKAHFENGELAWQLKETKTIAEASGVLGVAEYGDAFDFPVKRIFYLTNIQKDAVRGCHAHADLRQFIMCLSGSFEISLDCGINKATYAMCHSGQSLYLDGRVWREMRHFSSDAVMLVLCDREYRYDDVVRDYKTFKSNLKL